MSTTTRLKPAGWSLKPAGRSLKPAGRHRSVPISKVVVGEDEIAAVVEVLGSGNLREGPEVRAFEQEFADAVGARHALTASSGTSALQIAYQAIMQPGDEVLLPSPPLPFVPPRAWSWRSGQCLSFARSTPKL